MAILKKVKKIGDDKEKTELLPEKNNIAAISNDGGFILLIKHPWITEKSGDMLNLRKYVFLVDKTANKSEILKNIESAYKVKVSSVNIINIKGKIKRIKSKIGKIPDKKKAVVTLDKGHKIETMSI